MLRKTATNGYRTLIPASLRREMWYLRYTGRTYSASLPRRFAPFTKTYDRLPTAAEAQRSVDRWRAELGLEDAASLGRAVIIIVTYNNLAYTRYALASILEKTVYPEYQIIVVDNGSRQDLLELLRAAEREHDNIAVLFNDVNVGFSAANNIGLAHPQARESAYIALLNNDVIVTPGWLTTLIQHAQDPAIGMVGPVTNQIGNQARIPVGYRSLDEIDSFARRYVSEHAGQMFDIPMLCMYCVLLRRIVWDEVGSLDERFKIGMFEDDDYALRVRAAGYRIVCAEDVFIHHFGASSLSKLGEERLQVVFDENKRLFEDKWGNVWTPHQVRLTRGEELLWRAFKRLEHVVS